MKKSWILCCLLIFSILSAGAQKYASIALDDPVYKIIENAQLRGLCNQLPGAKPYSENQILSIVADLLHTPEKEAKLSRYEKEVLTMPLLMFMLPFEPI